MSRIFFQSLFASDVRMLACRRDPDPLADGCRKQRVYCKGKSYWLCPARLDLFEDADLDRPVSLAGVECFPSP